MSIIKHTFKITVLSDGPVEFEGGDNDPFDLGEINYAITEGDCLGNVEKISEEEVPDDQVKAECLALGNDGSFFLSLFEDDELYADKEEISGEV